MDQIKRLFLGRKKAYQIVFRGDGLGEELHPHALTVMAHLRKFCKGTGGNFSSDPYVHARNEGRREVFELICSQINATDEQIYNYIENIEENKNE